MDPRTIVKENLKRIANLGVTIIRINGSFFQIDGVDSILSLIHEAKSLNLKILLDLPGFKPRFTYLKGSIHYEAGKIMEVPLSSINYPDIITHMEHGDIIRINDGMVKLKIDKIEKKTVYFIPNRSGKLRRGKGFYLEKQGYRPVDHCLSELDIELIEFAKETKIDYVGISFVHNLQDLKLVEDMIAGSSTRYIPKIEARASLGDRNLIPILANCDKVIIDRGDMAGEMGLETVWYYQRKVLDLSSIYGCQVIMATQFLTSMLNKPLPSIAEIDSLYDLLNFGIKGVQLSEETCVGEHGYEVVKMINKSQKNWFKSQNPDVRLGKVVWIMGPTSSGKTTLAKKLVDKLSNSKIPVCHYDGDEVRELFGSELSFENESRLLVVRTLVYLAKKASGAGSNVVISALTANEDARKLVNEELPGSSLVYLDCPIAVCSKRDPKGLYENAKNGEIDTLIGFNTAYKKPDHIDITIDTSENNIEGCVKELLDSLIFSNRLKNWR